VNSKENFPSELTVYSLNPVQCLVDIDKLIVNIDIDSSIVMDGYSCTARLVLKLGSWHCTEFSYIEKTHFNNWISNSYVHSIVDTALIMMKYTTHVMLWLSRNLPRVAMAIPMRGLCMGHMWNLTLV